MHRHDRDLGLAVRRDDNSGSDTGNEAIPQRPKATGLRKAINDESERCSVVLRRCAAEPPEHPERAHDGYE